MSLKDDYYAGSTGLLEKLNDAFAAGVTFVITNNSALSSELISAAEQGKTKFSVSLTTNFNPSYLRGNNGNNLLRKAYFAGIQKGLADSEIYDYECQLTLDVSDSLSTKVRFNFDFSGS
jgi:hypothetical protein